MKKEDLAPQLQKKFHPPMDCGIEKGLVPEYENIWFVIPPAPPKKINFTLDLDKLKQANKILYALTSLQDMTNLDRLLSYLFVKREALNSSRMEGTWSTMSLLLSPNSLDAERNGEKESILNYANILINSVDDILKKNFSFTNKLIKKIHLEIMSKDPHYKGKAGHYREHTKVSEYVFIGGRKKEQSTYNPTPPHYVKNSMDKLLAWMTDEDFILESEAGGGIPFLVRMALCHSNFEAVHPFTDGNGRVGRILLSLQMMTEGYTPLFLSGFIEVYKDDYISVLEQSQKKLNHAPLINFLSEAVISSHTELTLSKNALGSLHTQWIKKVKPRKGSAAEKILDKLLEHPIFTAHQAVEWLGLSKPSVYKAIDQLLAAKIIRERTGGERFRIFAAEEVVEIISREYEESIEEALERAGKIL